MDSELNEHNEANIDSSKSSPVSSRRQKLDNHFEPLFVYVKVGEPSKDGTVINYSIRSQKTSNVKKHQVIRQYEDFEWLHHNLITQCSDIRGIIVPPLPPKPMVDARGAELPSTTQMDESYPSPTAEEYNKDSSNLERYLKLMIVHPRFGSSDTLEEFLTQVQPAARSKIRKGFMEFWSSAVDLKKSFQKDIDDFFQKERESEIEYSIHLRDSSDNFNKMVFALQRMSVSYGHLASTLIQTSNLYKDNNDLIHFLKNFSAACADAKYGAEVDATNDDKMLGSVLEHYMRYFHSAKVMLDERVKLLIEYDEALHALEKAKPAKKDAAEEAKVTAEANFSHCTENARKELKQFHRDRVLVMQDALYHHATARVKAGHKTHTLLAKSLSAIKQWPTFPNEASE